MIRVGGLILGLVLGLAGAIAWGGRLAHVRAVADLPGWTQGLAADAGVFAGHGRLDGAALHWDWTLSTGWGVTLTGPDWAAQGRAHPGPGGVRIDALSGLVPLALLTGDAGVIALTDGTLTAGWDGAILAGQIDGRQPGGRPVALIWRDGWQRLTP